MPTQVSADHSDEIGRIALLFSWLTPFCRDSPNGRPWAGFGRAGDCPYAWPAAVKKKTPVESAGALYGTFDRLRRKAHRALFASIDAPAE